MGKLNWSAILFVALGAVLLIVAWEGTQGKLWSAITGQESGVGGILPGTDISAPGTVGNKSPGCPTGFPQTLNNLCPPGYCSVDTVSGRKCIPQSSSYK